MPFQTELQKAYEDKYGKGPFIAVDSIVEFSNMVLFVKRSDNGKVALPGGMVDPGEFFYEAAIRELREETGLFILNYTTGRFFDFFDDPGRDPRGDIKTMVYKFFISSSHDDPFPNGFTFLTPKAGSDAKEIVWIPRADLLNRGDAKYDFYADHGRIAFEYLTRRDR